uniref:Reverse transcriptase domain-containing protein n=1 Tax=Gadus morhua TaxID=8049 RepID=A0A8C5D126_GADMO
MDAQNIKKTHTQTRRIYATTCPLDAIPSSLLQDVSSDILPFLTSIINSSLTSGIVPASLKTARIKPLLKKTTLNTTDIQDYRPVSLLSFPSKTLERAVANQLSSYLSSNNLLDPHQSGFKKAHSTETALLAVTESLRAARASSLSMVLILLDLSAAFDTVNHQILLAALGIAESALSWFTSYLTKRTYQVTWNGSLSKPCTLETGVPQGSVLGPLLFSLYTRSLGSVIASHGFSYHCYADDTQLFLSFPSSDKALIATRISECLADVSTWTTAHHLRLNLNKTELLLIPGKDCPHMDLLVTVEKITVSPSPTARNLSYAAPQTSLRWPDPADLHFTTSAESGPSSQGKQLSF